MTYYIKNFIDGFFDNLLFLFTRENDFIGELSLEGCRCYLTGNALCSKILNFWYNGYDKIIDNDIYVENIHPRDLMRILLKYGEVYIYGVKNYNFRRSNKNVRFRLIPFNEEKSYEFTYNSDYGALINSMIYKISSKLDIDYIDFDKMMSDDNIVKIVEKKTWSNNDEIAYFKKFENIMRCFNLCAYYDLLLNNETIKNIKNSINKKIKNNIKYSKEVVYCELVKILNFNNNEKILNIMYETKCFELMNMKFKDFEKTKNGLNNINNEEYLVRFIILLDGLDTDSVKKWCISNNINRVTNITNDIKKYYMLFDNCDDYLKIDTKYDLLKILTSIDNETNSEFELCREYIFEYFDYFITSIKSINYDKEKIKNLFNECINYPSSIKDLNITDTEIKNICNCEWKDIKNIKHKLLYVIQQDEFINNNEDIIIYLHKLN